MLGEAHALARAQAPERRFGSLNVVAQRGHRLAAKLEVHGEFRSGGRRACVSPYSDSHAALTGADAPTDAHVRFVPQPVPSESIIEAAAAAEADQASMAGGRRMVRDRAPREASPATELNRFSAEGALTGLYNQADALHRWAPVDYAFLPHS